MKLFAWAVLFILLVIIFSVLVYGLCGVLMAWVWKVVAVSTWPSLPVIEWWKFSISLYAVKLFHSLLVQSGSST